MSAWPPEVCLASDWEYDRDFFELLETRLNGLGRSTYCVWPHNLEQTVGRMEAGELRFRYLIDRATNTSPEFLELHRLSAAQGAGVLDSPAALAWASDKATMHLEFLSAGIPVPHTVILDPYQIRPEPTLAPCLLAPLGSPFVIKPANTTGGGVGVRHAARTAEEVLDARRTHPRDKYLLQERIVPAERGGRRFWFRVFWACGEVLCAWWDDKTHLYAPLLDPEVEGERLQELSSLAGRIARVCSLRLFSTEIAVTQDERFVVVDYVNESPDLRRGSLHVDGVPDALVHRITSAVAVAVHDSIPACP